MILKRIYGDAWKNRDWGVIIGGSLLAIVVFGPLILLPWMLLIKTLIRR